MRQFLDDVIHYRELVWTLALKDLRVRYKRSVLGFLWALLNPLLMMIVYTIVFSTIMRFSIENYAAFLIAGQLPWTFFSQALSYAVESIVGNGDILKKVYIEKSVFPVAAVLANLINFVLSLIPLILVYLVLRIPFHWTWFYMLVPLTGLVLFTLGCGFICAAANVFFRDVSHIIQIVLQAWFFFSPIIFPLALLPEKFHFWFRLNPMLYIINGFRMAIFYGQIPTAANGVMSIGVGLAAFVIGYLVFRRYQNSFVYYL